MIWTALYEISLAYLVIHLINAYLFWIHVYFHGEKTPQFLREAHDYHHRVWTERQVFRIHPIELAANSIPPVALVWSIYGSWIALAVYIVSLIESIRGHKHLRWLRLPKWYYKSASFAGIGFHMRHHENPAINFSLFLRGPWDKWMGTLG